MNRIKAGLIFVIALWLGFIAGTAQTEQQFTVNDIVFEGLNEVSQISVTDQLTFAVGDTITLNDVRDSAQRIFNLGLFKNVDPKPQENEDGMVVVFQLEENPVLRAIEISGNKQYQIGWDVIGLKIPFFWDIIKSDKIIEILKSHSVLPGQIINVNYLRLALEEITQVYAEKGYTLIQIDETQIFNSVIRGDILRIPIVEYIIEDVQIEGLSPEFEEIARDLISVPQDEPAKAAALQGTLAALTNGIYLEATGSDSVRFIPGSLVDKVIMSLQLKPRVLIEAPVEIKKIEFAGNTVYSNNRLQKHLGQWDETSLDNLALLHVLRGVYDLYHQNGHTRMRLNVQDVSAGTLRVGIDEGTVRDLTIQINYDKGYTRIHSPLAGDMEIQYFQIDEDGQELEVENNPVHTKPYVVNKALQIHPGNIFNQDRLRDTVRILLDLGYFEDVQVEFNELPDTNQIDLVLNIIEKKKLGSLNGALSWSDNGLVGKLTVAEKNLFGTGQDISLDYDRGIFGSARTNWALTYTTNGFFEKYKDFSVRLFQSFERPTFDEELTRAGGELSLTYPLNSTMDLLLRGRHENFQECLRDGASCQTPGVTDSVTLGLTNDTRDNPLFPMAGGRQVVQVEKAGGFSVGTEFTKAEVVFTQHFFVREDHNVSARLFGGWGMDMPAQEKFSLGGPGSIRGAIADKVDALAFLNLEYRIKWIEGFSTAFFTDWGLSNAKKLQGTTGLEIRVAVPLVGLTRIIIAWPVNDPAFRTFAPRFQFSFGSMF